MKGPVAYNSPMRIFQGLGTRRLPRSHFVVDISDRLRNHRRCYTRLGTGVKQPKMKVPHVRRDIPSHIPNFALFSPNRTLLDSNFSMQ